MQRFCFASLLAAAAFAQPPEEVVNDNTPLPDFLDIPDEYDTDGCKVEIKDFCDSVGGEWLAANCSCTVSEDNLPTADSAEDETKPTDMMYRNYGFFLGASTVISMSAMWQHWEEMDRRHHDHYGDRNDGLLIWIETLAIMSGSRPMNSLTPYVMNHYIESEFLTHWFAMMLKWDWIFDSVLGLALIITTYSVGAMDLTWPSIVALGIHAGGTQYFRPYVLCHLGYGHDKSAQEGDVEIVEEIVNGPLPVDNTEEEVDPLSPPDEDEVFML